jgi:DNA-binding MarR family transcriptional regulator
VDLSKRQLLKDDYEAIARLCHAVRKFLRFNEEQARAAGLTPKQLQAMLAIRGFPGREYATVGELANRLQTQHNSTVELVDRLEEAGLARRQAADEDRRQVRVFLTELGECALEDSCATHAPDWIELGRALQRELGGLLGP